MDFSGKAVLPTNIIDMKRRRRNSEWKEIKSAKKDTAVAKYKTFIIFFINYFLLKSKNYSRNYNT